MTVLFKPTAADIQHCQLSDFAAFVSQQTGQSYDSYAQLHQFSIEEKETFWRLIWQFAGVRGELNGRVLNQSTMPGTQWFPDSRLNFADNLLAVGQAQKTALIAVSENRQEQTISYAELRHQVMQLAAYLANDCGVEPGDRVCAYLGNTAEAIIAMLATTYLGAVWSSASPDFGLEGVLDRFSQIEPKVLIAGNGYQYGGKSYHRHQLVRQLVSALPSAVQLISVRVLPDEPEINGSESFAAIIQGHRPEPERHLFDFNHPLYILFSSGTTGKPKCIVHGAGGTLLQHIKELRLHGDISDQSVLFYFTTTGWMMWNWLASGLVTGATLVLYDGNPMHPQPDRLWTLVGKWSCTHFGTSAKYLASCHKMALKPETSDLDALRVIFSTGSPLAPDDFDWVYQQVKDSVMLHSISGGTDIVSCFVGGNPWLPVVRGKIQAANLGMAVESWNEQGQPVINERGELVCTQPAPCMPIKFWNDETGERYRAAYFERFPGVWAHGDFCSIDEQGQVVILGRSDTTLNPGGVRIGTAEIYRQVEMLSPIQDSLVVGKPVAGDIEVMLFVVLAGGESLTQELQQQIKTTIRQNTTPRHVPRHIIQVQAIPYTRSGKKVELAVMQILRGEEPKNLTALANADCLDEYRAFR
ncbi:MAG: acetoacetate--CoA ligase [Reinekea sp.]